jgi:hypothetical protein
MNALREILPATGQTLPQPTAWQERAALAYPLLLLLAGVLVLTAQLGGPLLHDSFAIDWVWADQFTAEVAHGNLYPRWLPLSDGGLGAPVFYYYPPLAFHLTSTFGVLGLSTYASLIAAFGAAFAASGIGCWHWLKGRSNWPLFGAAFFMAAPYHLFDYTVRGALAESVAIALIPAIAIGLTGVAERRGGTGLTALAYGAMIATHLPLALLVSVFLIAPYAIYHRRELAQFACAIGLGIGLAAIYLVPALALERYHDVGQLYRTANLQTTYWSIYRGNWADGTFAIVFAIMTLIGLAAAPAVLRGRDKWAMYAIGLSIVVSGVIPFLWSLPLLRDVQFPYRALPIAEFALATALARLPRKPSLAAASAALAPLVLSILILPGFHISGDSLQRLRTYHPDVYEYLPKGVMKPGQTRATLADIRDLRLPPPLVAGKVVEPHFYFPSWSCGTAEPHTKLLMHEPSCAPRIIWTAAEKIGAVISVLAGLLLTCLAFARGRRDRN